MPSHRSSRPVERARRALLTSILMLAVAGTVACGDDDPTSPSDGISGTFALQQANGSGLPYAFSVNGTDIVLSDGTLLLDDDGSWEFALTGTTDGVADTFDDNGTYERDGVDLTFTSERFAGQAYDGTVSADESIVTIEYDLDGDGTTDLALRFDR